MSLAVGLTGNETERTQEAHQGALPKESKSLKGPQRHPFQPGARSTCNCFLPGVGSKVQACGLCTVKRCGTVRRRRMPRALSPEDWVCGTRCGQWDPRKPLPSRTARLALRSPEVHVLSCRPDKTAPPAPPHPPLGSQVYRLPPQGRRTFLTAAATTQPARRSRP